MPPPNVLLIMVDQLAACWLPAYGHAIVRSPALDELAAGKMHFVGPDQLHGFEQRLTPTSIPRTWTGRPTGGCR
jgi:choline-sulfatase